MRKIIAVALAALALCLASCAKNPRCTLDAAKDKIATEESIIAYVYSDEKSYNVTKEIAEQIILGEWTEGGTSKGEKVLSITVGLQYEVCLYDDGSAMIYSGLAGITEKDRTFYTVKDGVNLDEICKLIRETCEVAEEVEDKGGVAVD